MNLTNPTVDDILTALTVKVSYMEPVTREGVIEVIKRLMVNKDLTQIFTQGELAQFFAVNTTQECQTGIATTRNVETG